MFLHSGQLLQGKAWYGRFSGRKQSGPSRLNVPSAYNMKIPSATVSRSNSLSSNAITKSTKSIKKLHIESERDSIRLSALTWRIPRPSGLQALSNCLNQRSSSMFRRACTDNDLAEVLYEDRNSGLVSVYKSSAKSNDIGRRKALLINIWKNRMTAVGLINNLSAKLFDQHPT